ncbi:MAG: hypothetical protein WDO16_17460 [Bacteroidota bacterium]
MKNDGKLLEPSQFVEEIRQPLDIKPVTIRLNDDEKTRFASLRFGIIQKPVLEQVEKDYISRLLQNFAMNRNCFEQLPRLPAEVLLQQPDPGAIG